DVSDVASINSLTAKLGRRPIDVLINNAGIMGPARQSGLDMDFDGLAQALAVNAIGPLHVTQALLPNLRAAGSAKIVAISSRLAMLADPGSSSLAYRASKAALNKLFQGVATDLKQDGIAVLILSPGWVRTDMGGRSAPLSVAESAAGILREIDELTLARTGHFRDYSGREVPW
ncbi:MAG TPA: SDR family NAD(P)-dependent oxidoreductase, partial [Beijerinckiaceae bacterium]|nr:SDR family NAD(P)-dependent oxidoreductase [Beijerinckiaceae bacterium]